MASADPLLGSISMFAGNFAPRGWEFCNGQLVQISQNTALFSLLGTIYGGDGRTTFALPDLRGRAPIHSGGGSGGSAGPGLAPRPIGQKQGDEYHTLTTVEMPSHNHLAQGEIKVSSGNATLQSATNNSTIATPGSPGGRNFDATYGFNEATPDITLNANSNSVQTQNSGGNQPHNNMQPYLAVNFIIAVVGIFPSRS
ncbi:phage tail protein [Olleya sp. Bg11-27]|uniref:phage tail protein n=1 Tax=Olleya sp. Bg11-27 TaxID=2058135 RepID=UPI000C300D50|nr:tail fiber protein [Olleya sp. Bg11-27]AUC74426.1 phage tail protein [Olleya sp. Bg11-27]